MSDLSASHCGCSQGISENNGCGCGFGNNWIWIIILLSCCGNNGMGWHNDDNDCCSWIWILLILFCCNKDHGCC